MFGCVCAQVVQYLISFCQPPPALHHFAIFDCHDSMIYQINMFAWWFFPWLACQCANTLSASTRRYLSLQHVDGSSALEVLQQCAM